MRYCLTSLAIYKAELYLECAERALETLKTPTTPQYRSTVEGIAREDTHNGSTSERSQKYPLITPFQGVHTPKKEDHNSPLLKRSQPSDQTVNRCPFMPRYKDIHGLEKINRLNESLEKFYNFLNTRFDGTNSTGVIALKQLVKKQLDYQHFANELDETDLTFFINFFNVVKGRINSTWGSRQRCRFFFCLGRQHNVRHLYKTLLFSNTAGINRVSTDLLYTALLSKLNSEFIALAENDPAMKFTYCKH